MKKITKKTIIVNGKKEIVYPYKDYNYLSLEGRLHAEYNNQGKFYQDVFHVSPNDAKIAGWDPTAQAFYIANPGWRQFIEDRGKIKKTEIIEEVEITELLWPES